LRKDRTRRPFTVEKRKIAPRKPAPEKSQPKARRRVESQMVQEVMLAARNCRFPRGWWNDD